MAPAGLHWPRILVRGAGWNQTAADSGKASGLPEGTDALRAGRSDTAIFSFLISLASGFWVWGVRATQSTGVEIRTTLPSICDGLSLHLHQNRQSAAKRPKSHP